MRRPERNRATRDSNIHLLLAGRKILFVDDDKGIRRAFQRNFRGSGADVHLAEDPLEAISMAQGEDYCVVITDLQMPGMSGLELVDTLWKENPAVSFVLVTGIMELNLPTERPSARAISSMVRKPWLPDQIFEAVIQAVELYDQRRQSQVESEAERIQVLIVEEDAADEQRIERMLQTTGDIQFATTRVSRLGAGMRILRSGKFDVILTDLALPDARGLDAVAGFQRVTPDLPIVVMSRSHDEGVAIQAVKAGAQDYLAKNEITRQGLQRTIRYAIERKNTDEHLAYLAHNDQLTGLPNRTLFTQRATAVIGQAVGRGSKPTVLLLDLDLFKNTNDTLGHSVGDKLLIQVADRLKCCVGERDLVARLGGDEFAVLIEQVDGEETASRVAADVLAALEPEFIIGRHHISIGGSLGITVFPENGNDIEQLLANADTAMYRAKDGGRNRYEFFDEEMHVKAVQWMELERELRGALERNEFEVHYQPQVDCKTNKVVSFEALLRWNSESLGPISPFHFIPVLEGIGLIDKVGAWVMQQSCQQLVQWRNFDPELKMAVNVSAIQFESDDLIGTVTQALDAALLPADALELEITEGLLMKDLDKTLATLRRLSDLGVRIAIDDFGTGYSNLSSLAVFPIDVLKIDKSITEMIGGHDGNAIVGAVVQLSHALGIEVLAEGVETSDELEYVRQVGIEVYQGYLFSKPMKPSDIESLLDFPRSVVPKTREAIRLRKQGCTTQQIVSLQMRS